MRLNPVLTELGAHPLAGLQETARRRQERGEPLIDFSLGDPDEPTPAFVRAALRAAVPEVSRYPTVAGLPALREAIAGYLGRRFGVTVDPDTQVLPTSGSKEAIFSTPLAFVDRAAGDVVVVPTPGYPVYERGAAFAGAAVHAVPVTADRLFGVADVPARVWERSRMVWICSPHNPTGAVARPDDLAALLARCREAGALLAADECYTDLYEDDPPPSLLQVAGPGMEGALVYLSCSKRSGMTGYRSAAMVGDPAAIAALRLLRTSTGTASPEFVQEAAAAAWADDAHAADRRAIFAAKRAVLRAAFEDTGHRVSGSGAGLYLWVAVDDETALAARLLDEGVLVSPGGIFGRGGEGHVRLALVPAVEECRTAAEVLKRCLTGN